MMNIVMTQTSNYIMRNLYPVAAGIVGAGIIYKIVQNGREMQSEGATLSDFLNKSRKLIFAGIIELVIVGLVEIFKSYYT